LPTAGTAVATSPVTAAALIVVGSLMVRAVTDVKWDDPTEALPAFISMLAMPLTYSIATGISLGFVLFPIFKLVAGRGKEVHWLLYVLAALFILRFIFL
ncbi:MAG: NCS2 family permease, partial [Clostridia bacterium]